MAKYIIMSLDEEKHSNPTCWIVSPQQGLSITSRKDESFDCHLNKVPIVTTLDTSILDNYIIVKSGSKVFQKIRKLINKEIGNEN